MATLRLMRTALPGVFSMHRADAYRLLALELEFWRALPPNQLIQRVGAPPARRVEQVDDQEVILETNATWTNAKQEAVFVKAVAYGASHWQNERVEEVTVVKVTHELP